MSDNTSEVPEIEKVNCKYKAIFILSSLLKKFNGQTPSPPRNINLSVEQIRTQIERLLARIDLERHRRDELDSQLKLFEDQCVPLNEFEWVTTKNPLLCYTVWLELKQICFDPEASNPEPLFTLKMPYDFHTSYEKTCYDALWRDNHPSSPIECRELILNFFALWDVPQSIKYLCLKFLRDRWNLHAAFKHKMLKHLETSNKEVSAWFCDYVADVIGIPISTATSQAETTKSACALAYLYAQIPLNDSRIITLDKVYQAYQSKKFRSKPQSEKGANVWLSSSDMQQLREIAKKKNVSEKRMLSILISKKFNELFV